MNPTNVYYIIISFIRVIKYLLTFMRLHVIFQLLCIMESGCTHITGEGFVLGVCPADVAVVCRVRGKRFPAVFALERPLAGVLADVRSEDAGGCERLGHSQIWSY